MRAFVAVLAVSLVVPTNLFAQQMTIQPGQRVRVTAPDCGYRKRVKTVERLRNDTLFLDPIDCPVNAVTRLEQWAGRGFSGWNVLRGAGLGMLTGAALGAILGASVEDFPCNDQCTRGEAAAILGIMGGLVGTPVGAIIGAFIWTDRWEEVPLDRLRVSVAPQRDGGIGLSLSVRF